MSNKLTLSASDRISSLLDEASFVEVGAYVTARNTDFNMQENDTPKDGVITGYGVINGKLVYVYSQDATVLGGAIGEMHAKKIAKIYDMAMKVGAPVVGLIDCAGLRLQEATDALNAFGEVYLKQTLASSNPTDYCNFWNMRWWSSAYSNTYRLYIYDSRGRKVIRKQPKCTGWKLSGKA